MKTIPFYLLLIMTFGLAGIEKIKAAQVPTWFVKQFSGTLMDVVPGGLTLSFFLIASFELSVCLLLGIGLYKREFLSTRSTQQVFLKYGVILAQITFIMLGFGQRLTHQFDAAASLFFYAILTFIAGQMALVKES